MCTRGSGPIYLKASVCAPEVVDLYISQGLSVCTGGSGPIYLKASVCAPEVVDLYISRPQCVHQR